MRTFAATTLVACVVLPFVSFAQSPPQVKYCKDLSGAYSRARANGKPPVPGVGQATADCPTSPDSAIPVLESALKEMKVELPPR